MKTAAIGTAGRRLLGADGGWPASSGTTAGNPLSRMLDVIELPGLGGIRF
jgi:hypothetical protein